MGSEKQDSRHQLVTSAEGLAQLLARLRKSGVVAFDTESASFHRYVDRVYLIQLSTDAETALVDPLAVSDVAGLGKVLRSPRTEIVFHDADYDLRVLDRDYGFRARNLFDTRVAAQLIGEPAVGLGSLLEKHLGVKLNKKFQRADWSRRPLTAGMLAYAADDTRHLLRLRKILTARLEQLGRLHWALEEFRRLEDVRWTGRKNDEREAFLRIRGAGRLSRRQLAVLDHAHRWRDGTARAMDRAPFRVLTNAALLEIARRTPTSTASLGEIAGVSPQLVRRSGRDLLAAVKAGLATPSAELPFVRRARAPAPDPGYETSLDRLKVLRDAAADTVGLDAGVVCPNGTLQTIAREAARSIADLQKIPALRNWQREVLGDDAILDAVDAAARA